MSCHPPPRPRDRREPILAPCISEQTQADLGLPDAIDLPIDRPRVASRDQLEVAIAGEVGRDAHRARVERSLSFHQVLWRAAYYPNIEVRGEPTLERETGIEFDWGKMVPAEGVPVDGWSAPFDTCLRLEKDTTVGFQLHLG